MKLNLGCGTDYREGYVNIDIDETVKADYHCDMADMPFDDNTFTEVYTNHSLEHHHDLFTIVDEMARVSKDGTIWYVNVPYWSWPRNQGNPHHKIHFSEDTFRFFDQGPNGIHKRRQQNYSVETVESELIFETDLGTLENQPRELKFKLICHK